MRAEPNHTDRSQEFMEDSQPSTGSVFRKSTASHLDQTSFECLTMFYNLFGVKDTTGLHCVQRILEAKPDTKQNRDVRRQSRSRIGSLWERGEDVRGRHGCE